MKVSSNKIPTNFLLAIAASKFKVSYSIETKFLPTRRAPGLFLWLACKSTKRLFCPPLLHSCRNYRSWKQPPQLVVNKNASSPGVCRILRMQTTCFHHQRLFTVNQRPISHAHGPEISELGSPLPACPTSPVQSEHIQIRIMCLGKCASPSLHLSPRVDLAFH